MPRVFRTGVHSLPTVSTIDPEFESAVKACASALRRLADSELPPDLLRQIERLSQRKEFLDSDQHAELSALTEFWRSRLIEKLEARTALQRLRDLAPDLVEQ